jgi:uncharacterized protein (TIGR02246 family)
MNKIKSSMLAILLLTGGFATNATAEKSLQAIIQERENEWSAAYNANDAERLGAFYEVDAILVPPGSQPVLGRALITETLSGLFPVLTNLTLTVEEVRALGDSYAVEIGRSTFQAVGEDGSLTPGSDNYQVVWHKGQDGIWRYVTDMFNPRD